MTDDEIRTAGAKAIADHIVGANVREVQNFCAAAMKLMLPHIEISDALDCAAELDAIVGAVGNYHAAALRKTREP